MWCRISNKNEIFSLTLYFCWQFIVPASGHAGLSVAHIEIRFVAGKIGIAWYSLKTLHEHRDTHEHARHFSISFSHSLGDIVPYNVGVPVLHRHIMGGDYF